MTRFLTRLLGRLPVGWLQLTHNRVRLATAVAGVAFANVLVFVQLGFLGALSTATVRPYGIFDADIVIQAPTTNTIGDADTVPRRRMYQALNVEGVERVAPLYVGKLEWNRDDGGTSTLRVLGIDPLKSTLKDRDVAVMLERLKLPDIAMLDRGSRLVPKQVYAGIDGGTPLNIEVNDRRLTLERTFFLGAGFDADGYMIVGEQTFFRLFHGRRSGAPNYIFVKVKEGANVAGVVEGLRRELSRDDTVVYSKAEATALDRSYQLTGRPVGIIFGFGVIIGILVGFVIVYQVLSTDVADHLAEYATFKSIGYRHRFFIGIVLEEAIVLATLGFIPGLFVSMGVYAIAARATELPLEMTVLRAATVLAGTLVMCSVSGAVATRRLSKADPAALFG